MAELLMPITKLWPLTVMGLRVVRGTLPLCTNDL